jgi:hypothetical protein
MLGNTETMQMLELLECQDNTAYLPNHNDLSIKVQYLPHPPSQPSYLMPNPSSLPLPTTGCLKSPACKKSMLLPFSESYYDGRGSLSGLLSLIMTCCL